MKGSGGKGSFLGVAITKHCKIEYGKLVTVIQSWFPGLPFLIWEAKRKKKH